MTSLQPKNVASDVEEHETESTPLLAKAVDDSSYRPDVDGLRAFAVAAVVLYHMNPKWVPAGFAGVDIFFVISGFVVTSSLYAHKEMDQNAGDFILGFFLRRAKRLLPVLALVISVSGAALAISAPLWEAEMTPKFLKVGMAGMFGNANNWMLFGEVHDYWTQDDAAFNDYHPFLHLWSLGVEEQFYVFFPFVMLAGLGSSAASNLPWGESRSRLMTILSITVGCSMISAYFCQATGRDLRSFYFLPCRFFELALGAMVLPLCAEIKAVFEEKLWLLKLMEVSAAVLLLAAVIVTPHGAAAGFPFPWALLPSFAAMLYIAVGTATPHTWLNKAFASQGIVYIGRISYSIYLWHLPVLAIVQWMTVEGRSSILNNMFSGVLTLALSVFSFHIVEDPLRRLKGVTKVEVLGAAVLSSAAVSAYLYMLLQARLLTSGAQASLVRLTSLLAAVIFALCSQHLAWDLHDRLFLIVAVCFAMLIAQETYLLMQASAEDATGTAYMLIEHKQSAGMSRGRYACLEQLSRSDTMTHHGSCYGL
eukprot:TRINITY_DN9330_c0_g1_i1.p1 TRINITY_DN9330_c0_g1~~TRINITY_DN9330_c0_g1_i1.p1  ORF type:complete len:535 (-),score=102.93 TRINITY_DN9330_c0_g1_i1:21-1625(-)